MYYTGALKDVPDERDYQIKDFLAGAIPLPSEYDLTDKMPPVRFQGSEPACVAFAACAVKGYQEKLEGHENVIFSPRFLYDRIAQPGGGAYVRDVMKVLADVGVPPESCEPFVLNNVGTPCEKALELAAPNKIKAYARLNTLEEMKRCLVENGAFVIALYTNRSWGETTTGIVTTGEKNGAHAVVFVGYNDAKQQVKFFNTSWGESWGDKGFGYVLYQDFDKVLMDAWSSVDIPDAEEEKPEPEPEKPITNNGTLIDWIIKIIRFIFGGK